MIHVLRYCLLSIQYLLDLGHLGAERAPLIHFLPDSGLILLQLFNLPDQLKKKKIINMNKKMGANTNLSNTQA